MSETKGSDESSRALPRLIIPESIPGFSQKVIPLLEAGGVQAFAKERTGEIPLFPERSIPVDNHPFLSNRTARMIIRNQLLSYVTRGWAMKDRFENNPIERNRWELRSEEAVTGLFRAQYLDRNQFRANVMLGVISGTSDLLDVLLARSDEGDAEAEKYFRDCNNAHREIISTITSTYDTMEYPDKLAVVRRVNDLAITVVKNVLLDSVSYRKTAIT